MTATTKLALELLQNNAANQTLANTTFAQLNQLVQAGAADRTNTPPGSPVDESLYIVTSTATGAWAGKENQLAYWLTSTNAWQFIVAREGFLIHVNDEDTFYKFDGSSWAVFSSGGGSFTGGTLSTALNEAPPATVASASTTNIGAADRNTVNITGTTTITAFDTIASGAVRRLVFGGALTLTHNGTSLILPTGSNITTAAGDVAEFLSLGSGNWRCVDYTKANGQALAGGSGFTGGTLTSALNEATPVSIASASTVNIGAAAANTINITGTTTITAFDAISSGATRRVIFAGALTLTHNATSLILPTSSNITTAAGDVAEFLSLGSGNWRCVDYTRANGQALAGSSSGNTTQTVSSSSGVLNLSSTTSETLLLTTSENVTSISWPSGVAGQSIQRRLVVTQGGAGNYTLPSTTANWGSITVDGGGSIPQPATGVGSSTTYVLVNDNNTGWRMYLDNSRQSNPYATAGGTANSLTLSINHAPSKLAAYAQGDMVRARVGTTNTGAMTLAVDGLSAVAVKTVTGADTPAGYIRTDVDTQFTYNGTYWVADRLVEYGSNANGEFWRYADGKLECFSGTLSITITTASAQIFASGAGSPSWTFPATFVSAPRCITYPANNLAMSGGNPGATTTSVTLRALASTSLAAMDCYGEAKGRWY